MQPVQQIQHVVADPVQPMVAAASPIQISPQAKAAAEDKLKQVFVLQDDTPEQDKVKMAKEPVKYIQDIVKKKKEEAQEILRIKEEEAKKEIDRVVRIKKDWDKKQDQEKKDKKRTDSKDTNLDKVAEKAKNQTSTDKIADPPAKQQPPQQQSPQQQ